LIRQFPIKGTGLSINETASGLADLGGRPMTILNDQNRHPGFLQSAKRQVTLVIVAIILVVFLSMVLHLL
jgi:hypothetical protein